MLRKVYPALSLPTRNIFTRSGFLKSSDCQTLKLYFLTVLFHAAVEVVREKGFHLDVEDYLAGVLIMASELVSAHLSKESFTCC